MKRAFLAVTPATLALAFACSSSESSQPGAGGAAGMAGSSGTAGAGGPATGGGAGSSGSSASAGAGGTGGTSSGAGGRANAVGTGGAAGGAGSGGSGAGSGGALGGGMSTAGTPSAGGSGGVEPSGGQAGEGVITGTPAEDALMDLPAIRQEHNVVAAAGKIYVITGYASGGGGLQVTNSVLAYTPESDSWAAVENFPVPMNHGNAGAVNEKIYVAGFYVNGMTEATAQTFEYDPAGDTWTEKEAMPAGSERGAGCVAVDAGKMYVIGGARGGMSVATATVYDVAADSWEMLPDLPEQREHCVAGAIDGVIYVAGGREDSITNIQDTTWAFDVAAGEWVEKAPLMPSRGGLAGAVLGGRLIVFGGEGNPASGTNGIFDSIDAYDPGTDSWEKLGVMDVPRHGYGAAVLNDRIYLPGGAIRQGGAAAADASVFYFE